MFDFINTAHVTDIEKQQVVRFKDALRRDIRENPQLAAAFLLMDNFAVFEPEDFPEALRDIGLFADANAYDQNCWHVCREVGGGRPALLYTEPFTGLGMA